MEKPMINYRIDRNRVDISRWYGNGDPAGNEKYRFPILKTLIVVLAGT